MKTFKCFILLATVFILACCSKNKQALNVDTWTNQHIEACVPKIKQGLSSIPLDIGFTTNRTDVRRYDSFASARPFMITQDLQVIDLTSDLLSDDQAGQVGVQMNGFSPDGKTAYIQRLWNEPQHAMYEEAKGELIPTPETYRYDLYARDIDGGQALNLTADGPSFFHQGPMAFAAIPGKLFFNALMNGENRLYEMNTDGSDKKPFALTSGFSYGLNISPDGKKYAFHAIQGHYRIFVGDIQTGKETEVPTPCELNFAPIFSPDSSKIAFLCDGNYWTAKADGTDVKFLASRKGAPYVVTHMTTVDHHGGGSDLITWTGDSSGLIHGQMVNGVWELVVSNDSGSEALTVSAEGSRNVFPRISRDGQWLIFQANKSADRTKGLDVFIMNLSTKEEIQVTDLDPACNARYAMPR